ncbi:MAG TPA: hypothetical protein VF589_07255 [Allosphingosinicella sp.]
MQLLIILALAAAGSAVRVGPSAAELAAAIRASPVVSGPVTFRTDTIGSVRCHRTEEEPTEYFCRFRARAKEGSWMRRSAILAMDGGRWILLSLD